MAEPRPEVNYSFYNTSYYTYTRGLMYEDGPQQNNGNLGGWDETVDLSRYDSGTTPANFAAPQLATYDAESDVRRTESESASDFEAHASPDSWSSGTTPENFDAPQQATHDAESNVRQTDCQSASDFEARASPDSSSSGTTPGNFAAPQQATCDAESDVMRTESESASDFEAHTSPDSWSSGSIAEPSLPQLAPAERVEGAHDSEASSRSPAGSLTPEPGFHTVTGSENGTSNASQVPQPVPEKSRVSTSKGKVRVAFSEMQMSALSQRFSVQRYLTPAEMRDLAGMIGLSYKQVKTWFQNRRMKLRRHQKDNTWLCERSNIRDGPIHATMYNHNIPPNIQPYQGEAQPQFRENYNMMPFRDPAMQKMNFYLSAMGNSAGSAGSAGCASWSSNTSQGARSQMASWPIPPGVSHYEYNPSAFNPSSVTNCYDTSFQSQNMEPVNNCPFVNTGVVQNASQ